VSSRSGEACCELLYSVYLTFASSSYAYEGKERAGNREWEEGEGREARERVGGMGMGREGELEGGRNRKQFYTQWWWRHE